MEAGPVGEEMTGGDAAQGIVPFSRLLEQLHAGAVVAKGPEIERLPQRKAVGSAEAVTKCRPLPVTGSCPAEWRRVVRFTT
jgi:hypothetical protein